MMKMIKMTNQITIPIKNRDKNDESNPYFNKKDDGNQDSDTSSKTDLDDLHNLKSFLYKELK